MTVAFAERLHIVDELMGNLELVTRAGQQHVMNRILSILRGEILSLGFPLATADLSSLLDAMTELEHEAGRIAPTAAAFNLHARVVAGVLGRSDTSLFPTLFAETSVWPTSGSGAIYEGKMDTKARLTKQGIKDLNHYGPKPDRPAPGAPSPAGEGEAKASPPASDKKPDTTISSGA